MTDNTALRDWTNRVWTRLAAGDTILEAKTSADADYSPGPASPVIYGDTASTLYAVYE